MVPRHQLCGLIIGVLLTVSVRATASEPPLYGNSYALVVGVAKYASSKWPTLAYAAKDAEAMGKFLQAQGFKVEYRVDERATRASIVSFLEDDLAPKLKKDDRVLFFFSGHGATREYGAEEYGYLVPYDADASAASWISMEEIRSLSGKMNVAKHQFFIMDSCYGGTFARKALYGSIPEDRPDYIRAVTERAARQYVTAGGKTQQVLAAGPKGFSYFTGFLLEGLQDGLGDLNGDGYITASELVSYLESRASNEYQTPGYGTLAEHALGNFVFRSPKGAVASLPREEPPTPSPFGLKAQIEIDPVEKQHELTVEARVREQPSSLSAEVTTLRKGSLVWVAGKVRGQDWYLIEQQRTRGYVFGSGLDQAGTPQGSTLPATAPLAPGKETAGIVEYYRRKANVPRDVAVTVKHLGPSKTAGARTGELDVGGKKVEFMVSDDGRLATFGDLEDLTIDPSKVMMAKINLKGEPSRGPADARVTLVEYSDFQCPFCSRAYATIEEQVLREYGDKIRFYYKNYPLSFHPWAMPAAVAAECAKLQQPDAFWTVYRGFFGHQSDITADNVKEKALSFLASEGIDRSKFIDCYDKKKTGDKVNADLAEGAAVGVTGTPSFVINGRLLVGAQPFEKFKSVIDDELASRR